MASAHLASPPSSLIRFAAELHSHREELSRLAADRIREQVPACRLVPPQDLFDSCLRHLDAATDALRDGSTEDLPTYEITVATMSRRESQGVSVADQIRGHGGMMTVVFEHLIDYSMGAGISPAEVVLVAQLLWSIRDNHSARVGSIHQDRELERRSLVRERERQFLHALLLDGQPYDDVAHMTGFRRLDTNLSYHAVRASTGERPIEEVRRALEAAGSTVSAPAFFAIAGTACIGLTAVELRPIDGVTIALGPAERIDAIARSFDIASELHDAAVRLHREGVFTQRSLGWKVAVGTNLQLGAQLLERYVAPLTGAGESGAVLLSTLDAFFEHDLNYADAARALSVHPNSLRYRLRKVEAALDVDLGDLDTQIELCWALLFRHTIDRI